MLISYCHCYQHTLVNTYMLEHFVGVLYLSCTKILDMTFSQLRHSLSDEDVTVTDMTRKESPISTCHQAADPSWEREMAQLPAVLVLPFKARFASITASGPLIALFPLRASPKRKQNTQSLKPRAKRVGSNHNSAICYSKVDIINWITIHVLSGSPSVPKPTGRTSCKAWKIPGTPFPNMV